MGKIVGQNEELVNVFVDKSELSLIADLLRVRINTFNSLCYSSKEDTDKKLLYDYRDSYLDGLVLNIIQKLA